MAKTTEPANEETDQAQSDTKTQAQSIEMSEAHDVESQGANSSIDLLLNVNINVTVTLGKTEVPVRRLLQLGPGSVLKLDKPIDTPADLYLKGAKFATGDIVAVDGRFAVRIKQILGVSTSQAGTDAGEVQKQHDATEAASS